MDSQESHSLSSRILKELANDSMARFEKNMARFDKKTSSVAQERAGAEVDVKVEAEAEAKANVRE